MLYREWIARGRLRAIGRRRPARAWQVALRVGVLMPLLSAGCIVADGDAICSKDQIEMKGESTHYCICRPGFVLDDDNVGCKACGENEDSSENLCVCKPGYARPSAGGACMASSLGADCASDADCSGEVSTCVHDGAASYCSSSGCRSSSECQPTWFCDLGGDQSVCKKPPEGYRKPCEGPADCAGSAATYCDSFQSHSCLVQGCGAGMPCPGDWSCCNIAVISVSLCVEPTALVNGSCPGGGTLVAP